MHHHCRDMDLMVSSVCRGSVRSSASSRTTRWRYGYCTSVGGYSWSTNSVYQSFQANCDCADCFTGTYSREEREPYRDWEETPRPAPFRGKWRGRGRGRGFAGHDDDRRPHWDRDRDRPRRYEDDHGSARGGGRGSYNDRFDGNREGGYSNTPQTSYALPAQQQYNEPPAAAPVSDHIHESSLRF